MMRLICGLLFSVTLAGASLDEDLLVAIRNGEISAVRKLLDGGASWKAHDADGATALMLAALYAKSDLVVRPR